MVKSGRRMTRFQGAQTLPWSVRPSAQIGRVAMALAPQGQFKVDLTVMLPASTSAPPVAQNAKRRTPHAWKAGLRPCTAASDDPR